MSGRMVVHEAGKAVQKAEAVGSDYVHEAVVSEALALGNSLRCVAPTTMCLRPSVTPTDPL